MATPYDESVNLPVSSGLGNQAQAGELVISITQEGLLVDGDPESVLSYLDQIKATAGHLVDIADVTKGAVGTFAGLAVGVASVFAQNAQFVQLSAKSMEAIRTGGALR